MRELDIAHAGPHAFALKQTKESRRGVSIGRFQRSEALVARFSQIEGYRCLSLTRALGVVKCQLAVV
jgi:hypothetical protein